MRRKKKMILLTYLVAIAAIVGSKWYQNNKETKYIQMSRQTTPECLNPRNCPTCPYYQECYGPEVDI